MVLSVNNLLFAATTLLLSVYTASGLVQCCISCGFDEAGEVCEGIGGFDPSVPFYYYQGLPPEFGGMEYCFNRGYRAYKKPLVNSAGQMIDSNGDPTNDPDEFIWEGDCYHSGQCPNGDCHTNPNCEGDGFEGMPGYGSPDPRQTFDYCKSNGYGYMWTWYEEWECQSIAEIEATCSGGEVQCPDPTGARPTDDSPGDTIPCGPDGGGPIGGPVDAVDSPPAAPGGDAPAPAPLYTEMGGDPHIKSWGGEWFFYQGECDLVLLSAPRFAKRPGMPPKKLVVHVRTTIRYDYSFIEAAAIQIGNDILEVASWGDYAVNGVDTPYLGGKAGHMANNMFKIHHTVINKKHQIFDIEITPTQNITVVTFKDLVTVKFNGADEEHFGDSVGIMGDYHGKFLARDGSEMSVEGDGAIAFGQEWQVREDEGMLFRSVRPPQAPEEKCRLPDHDAIQTLRGSRRLGEGAVTREQADEACRKYHRKADVGACIFDVMATGDLEVAGAGVL